jgi:5-(carboxyamino)imidazole ribonucleotide synthase
MGEAERIVPGATLGVMGGGQLGRMFAMAAAAMGYRTLVFAPEADCPASHVATGHIQAQYDDQARLETFAKACAAVTIEFENVPVEALSFVAKHTRVRPGPETLAIAQDRLEERAFLDRHSLPAAAHQSAHSADDLAAAAKALGTPLIVKSARFGYDGRGQVVIHDPQEAASAWDQLSTNAALCEKPVDFAGEISVLVARLPSGEITTFGPIENHHRSHILDFSIVPASFDAAVGQKAIEIAQHVAEAVQLEGLICVEMFVEKTGGVLINELAPRPHNSGHLTIEAATISQFQVQTRALTSMPLGAMHQRTPAAMANLLGELWTDSEPAWQHALAVESLDLHLYGKTQPRPGRKMGHLTACDHTAHSAYEKARHTRQQLTQKPAPTP